MNATPLLFVTLTALLGGCAQVPHISADLAHIRREREDSAAVMVLDYDLIRSEGKVAVVGRVGRKSYEADTSQTHLDIVLQSPEGSTLGAITAAFSPRQISRNHRRAGRADYRVLLDPLPPGIARVIVRAHDGSHSAP